MRNKSMDKENKYEAVAETSVLYGNNRALAALAFYHGMYAMAAAEAEGLKVKARIQAPAGTEKSYVSWLKQDLREKSKKEGIRKAEIETAVNGALLVPEVTVTISGVTEKKRKGSKEAEEKAVVMTKWAGMEGMLRIVSEKQEELSGHFAPAFLREIQKYQICPENLREIDAVRESGADIVLHVGHGGILAALWRLAEQTGGGMRIDMKKIPVLQETIEVCEYFRLNPYQLTSAGCFLFTVSDGEKAVQMLEKRGIAARMIGRITAGRDKVIQNGEEIRYLDRPAPDEIFKLYQ
ncbi:AIR synthase-related protein [Claveliimonas bilis]|uniref:Hydrogenase n=1 Tax=Claveliimonas bilis TaxID=3028070 RepID=A0ABN6YYS8_9FIRM|nr:AIR synthase-related protein [Claveliimonas bilis]BDZ76060.1 hydrogenase [Claveliimonas bilis]